MEQALKVLNIVRGGLLVSVVLYFLVAEQIRRSASPQPAPGSVILYVISFVALTSLVIAVLLRQKISGVAEEVLRTRPDDAAALARWRTGNILFLAICEAVALYGLVLRILGFAMTQTLPFFVVAFVAMLLLGPRRPS